jgi:dinuclear metal center YbgI/SA1388 family protein
MHVNASLDEIVVYLDGLLDTPKYQSEEASNGLLYRAGAGVSKFAVAVNTSMATIVGAAKTGAQLLVVHHTTWPGIDLHLYGEKMRALEAGGVSLYGAHASLDCAEGWGNAWALAERLGVRAETTFCEMYGGRAGTLGGFDGGSFAELIQRASRALGVQVEAHEHAQTCARVAIVPGAGGNTSWMDEARRLGADTYITGEGSMYTRMFAREVGMNLVMGTHHATETPGIMALGERLGAETSLPWEFLPDSADVF